MEIIAEVGSTWRRSHPEDSLQAVLTSIRSAKFAGATHIKFQIWNADRFVSESRAPDAYIRAQKYQLPIKWLPQMATLAKEVKINLGASVFDIETLIDVAPFLSFLKIASGDIVNHGLIEAAASIAEEREIPLYLSTGAASAREIEDALSLCKKPHPRGMLIALQCVSSYPADAVDYNLCAIRKMPFELADAVGISDHTLTSTLGEVAVGYGLRIFEKHFMLQGTPRVCPDYRVALSPAVFEEWVTNLNRAVRIMGDGIKTVAVCEAPERVWARRGVDGLRPAKK